MSNLQKSSKEIVNSEQAEIQRIVEGLSAGQIFVEERHGYLLKVEEIKGDTVHYEHSQDGGKTWRHYGSSKLQEFVSRHGYPIESVEEWLKEVNQVITGEKSLDEYRDNLEESSSTDLIAVRSKEFYLALQESIEQKKKKAELIYKGVQYQMEIKKRELDRFRSELSVVVEGFREKVKQVEKVIWTIELYLGIQEDIVQIQEGPLASENDTIHFWQNTLYMDEEVGNPEDGGLDSNSIEGFDKWLLQYSNFYKKYNYELLIPQNKGLVCLKVRREDKKYVDNPFLNGFMNQPNHLTYILLRNGKSLYRIWGDINIHPKLFPNRDELQKLKEKWEYIEDISAQKDTNWIGESKYGHIHNAEKEKKDIENYLFRYKQYMIMMQGLIDRTEVFYPLPGRISVMNEESHNKGQVKFVYEDDLRLSDGKLGFYQWQEKVNESISEGSRIIYVREKSNSDRYFEPHERFDKRFQNGRYYGGRYHYNLPSYPATGLYQVKNYVAVEYLKKKAFATCREEIPDYVSEHWTESVFETIQYPMPYAVKVNGSFVYENTEVKHPAIYYNPKDDVRLGWGWQTSERKNNISYKIHLKDSDILNYDGIDLKDVEFYLYDRRHRRHYLRMMPVLYEIKKQRENELAQELNFVKGLVEDMKRNQQKIENPRQAIWDAIEWFKTKNKWKRPLTEHDELAWRMVRKKLKLS